MRITLTLAAPLFALLSTGGVQAAISQTAINDVLAQCPVEARVGKCGNAVVDFANGLPASIERNDDLVALAQALAQEAAGGQVSPIICQELEIGIRLASQAAAGTKTRAEIEAIADALCVADVDLTVTGSIDGSAGNGGGDDDNNSYTPPPSLVEQDDDNSNSGDTPPPVDNPPPADDGGGDDDEESDTGPAPIEIE